MKLLPKEIADEQMRQTVELLLNLIEQLNSKVIELEAETQKLYQPAFIEVKPPLIPFARSAFPCACRRRGV